MPLDGKAWRAEPTSPSNASAPDRARVHATCVTLADQGILILGPSGSGKSDLAVGLIGRGGRLVADDQVWLCPDAGALVATPAPTLKGLLEVRGVGIFRVDAAAGCRVALAVDLTRQPCAERLPDPTTFSCLGIDIPLIRVDPRSPSAAAIVALALHAERVA